MKQLNEVKIVNEENDEKIKEQQIDSFAYYANTRFRSFLVLDM